MEKNNERTKVVFKVVGNVLYIGLCVGAMIIEWKALGVVNKTTFGRFGKLFVKAGLYRGMLTNCETIFDEGKELLNTVKGYYSRKIEEEAERTNELIKSIRTDIDSVNKKTIDEALKEFEELGIDIDSCRDEIQKNIDEIFKEYKVD